MNTKLIRKATGLIIAFFAIVSISMAQQSSQLTIDNYTLNINGTSNLHDWTMEAEKLSGKVNAVLNEATIENFKETRITVDVEEIESGKRIMNNKTYEALKSEKHPTITYQLKSVQNFYAAGSRFSGKAQGLLTVAGVTKKVEIPFSGKIKDGGKSITVNGNYTLQMTSYNVDPPTAMLGSLKTGDKVTLEYEFTFK